MYRFTSAVLTRGDVVNLVSRIRDLHSQGRATNATLSTFYALDDDTAPYNSHICLHPVFFIEVHACLMYYK